MKNIGLAFLLFCSSILPILADSMPPGFNNNSSETPIPVDGGISLLLAAGAAYGIKKFRDRRKASSKAKVDDGPTVE